MAQPGRMEHTAGWVAVVAKSQKMSTTSAEDVEPSLSQYNGGTQGYVFSHTNQMAGKPRERPVTLPFMRHGCGSCAWPPKTVVYHLYCGIVVLGTGSLFSTQFRTPTCSRDQSASRRRGPCGGGQSTGTG